MAAHALASLQAGGCAEPIGLNGEPVKTWHCMHWLRPAGGHARAHRSEWRSPSRPDIACIGSALQADMPEPIDFNGELATVGLSNIIVGLTGSGYTGGWGL